MNPVVHFEMPYDDRDRMAAFYARAFGWEIRMLGPEMGDYALATTVKEGDPVRQAPGAVNGGFFPRRSDWPDQHPSVVIAVPDIAAAMAAVRSAGGEVLGEPMPIPGVGDYVSFRDTEGNRASLLQPLAQPPQCGAGG